MAIWQVEFKLVLRNEEGFSGALAFDTLPLEQTFRKGESWCDDNWVYGTLEGTCVELFWFENKLDEISVRIHVVEISVEEIVCIRDFAAINDLVILYNDQVFDVTIDNIYTIIKQSKAFSYTHNPLKFINDLSDSTNENWGN